MNRENRTAETTKKATDANRDPITGTPGAHPVGTGVGAAGGGSAGAAIERRSADLSARRSVWLPARSRAAWLAKAPRKP